MPPPRFSFPASFSLFVLCYLFFLPFPTISTIPSSTRQAYITLLYGDSYLLPVRVMMHSLLINSPDVSTSLRDRVVIVVIGPTSPQSIHQLHTDGLTVIPVAATHSPYAHDPKFQSRFFHVMTKLTVFNMTQYSRLVFIDADSLILSDLSPLFSCGNLCATFINPCYFNSGLMVITPNSTVFADMQRVLPSTPSYDGGDQGFLNSFFPQLLNAPMFDPLSPPVSQPPFSRLPFSWHIDHSSYFPTFTFEFEKSDRCGLRRNIEWLGPPFLKPWLWYTYAAFDLSWTWNGYRRQLSNSYPPNLGTRCKAVILVVLCYALFIWLVCIFELRTTIPSPLLRFLPKCCPFRNVSDDMSAVYPVVFGILLWMFAFGLCLTLVPPILPPYPATFVFFHLRVAANLVVLVLIGSVLCLGQRRPGSGRPAYIVQGRSMRTVFRRTVVWAVGDASLLIIWVTILWQIAFRTMWTKGAGILFAITTEGIMVVVMIADVTLVWLRLADSVWSRLDS